MDDEVSDLKINPILLPLLEDDAEIAELALKDPAELMEIFTVMEE